MKGVFSTFLLLQPLLNEAMLFVLSLVSGGCLSTFLLLQPLLNEAMLFVLSLVSWRVVGCYM